MVSIFLVPAVSWFGLQTGVWFDSHGQCMLGNSKTKINSFYHIHYFY